MFKTKKAFELIKTEILIKGIFILSKNISPALLLDLVRFLYIYLYIVYNLYKLCLPTIKAKSSGLCLGTTITKRNVICY